MRIIEETQLDFSDVLIRPARSNINSRNDVDIFRTFTKKVDGEEISFSCIPICCANMGSIAIPAMAKIFVENGFLCAMEKHIEFNELNKLYRDLQKKENKDKVEKGLYTNRIAISIGVNEDFNYIKELNKTYSVNIINIDVANGYMTKLQERVREIRKTFPKAWIIAGTVVTGDIVTDLLNCGADIIRCGIGQGQMCLSRVVAGVGRPTISMLQECSDAAHQIHGYVMNDGGCSCPGDVCKALGCADFTMIGSLFAGADEADGDIVKIDGVKYKKFAGMSSEYAQKKYFGGFKNYRSSEGRQKLMKCTGPLKNTLEYILGGVRSCMAYIGCRKIKHFQKHCVFYKVNKQLNTTFDSNKDFIK